MENFNTALFLEEKEEEEEALLVDAAADDDTELIVVVDVNIFIIFAFPCEWRKETGVFGQILYLKDFLDTKF